MRDSIGVYYRAASDEDAFGYRIAEITSSLHEENHTYRDGDNTTLASVFL